jgi:hypothetical protein
MNATDKSGVAEKPAKGKNGGPRPNSGRKPIEKRLSNYERAVKLLDDNVEKALDVLIKGLTDPDKNYRMRCAEILLKKTIPDKKHIDMPAMEITIKYADD